MIGDTTESHCYQCEEVTVQVILDEDGTAAECTVCYAENALS